MNAVYFLIDFIFGLYLMIVLLRLWLQAARADFYNPLSQGIVKATHPILAPMRRVLPSIGPIDTAIVVLALIVSSVKIIVINALFSSGFPAISALAVGAVIDVIKEGLQLIFWVLLLRAILSWVSQGSSPVEYLLHQLTEPLLAPIRKILPSTGGFDFSILIAIVALQFFQILLNDVLRTLLSA
ncbi:YggT family protein [Alteromonas sp. 5E99-2]|uniref:YggT family protein n=1 Tax=Alteromonas sp. 5E99-2 TaxID=2817683 RepID=UPI001A992F14|nr:YggT family protein [Alteromonas sp. 5E99-2]MBO1256386.1 YggT family protein [Alteromonas sp. 5E99-2]